MRENIGPDLFSVGDQREDLPLLIALHHGENICYHKVYFIMADTKFLAAGDLKADPFDSKVELRHFCPHFTGRVSTCGTGTTPLPHGGQACDVLI